MFEVCPNVNRREHGIGWTHYGNKQINCLYTMQIHMEFVWIHEIQNLWPDMRFRMYTHTVTTFMKFQNSLNITIK